MIVIKLLLAFLIPPLAVLWQAGFGFRFLFNVFLTICCLFIPGIIHALWVLLKIE